MISTDRCPARAKKPLRMVKLRSAMPCYGTSAIHCISSMGRNERGRHRVGRRIRVNNHTRANFFRQPASKTAKFSRSYPVNNPVLARFGRGYTLLPHPANRSDAFGVMASGQLPEQLLRCNHFTLLSIPAFRMRQVDLVEAQAGAVWQRIRGQYRSSRAPA